MSTNSNVEVIHRPNVLKKMASEPDGMTYEEMRDKANAEVEFMQPDFVDWAQACIDDMFAIVARIEAEPAEAAVLTHALTRSAEQLVDNTDTFDRPLLGDVASMLFEILTDIAESGEHLGAIDDRHMELVTQQLNALRLVLAKNIKGPGGSNGRALKHELRRAIGNLRGGPTTE